MPDVTPWYGNDQLQSTWFPEQATVLENVSRGPRWYRLVVRAPRAAQLAVAGQFAHCSVVPAGSPGCDLQARRPFSFCQIRPGEGTLIFIYQAGPGRGTLALATVPPGARLEILAPLGRSFPHPRRLAGRRLALVGGGLGIPPLVAGAEWAVRSGTEVWAICGAESVSGLAGAEEMEAAGAVITVVTEDGSAGRPGLATDPLAVWLEDRTVDEVWACGPEPMLAAVQTLCARAGVAAWLSMERPMACGFGACMSCTVPAARPAPGRWYLKCCVDGPVFPAKEVQVGG